MIDHPPCQYGQLTRAEYLAGIRRPLCTRPSTEVFEQTSGPGAPYVLHLCFDHAEEMDITRPFPTEGPA